MAVQSFLSLALVAVAAASFAPGVQAQYAHGGYGPVLVCESHDGRNRYCPADTRGGVTLLAQRSRSSCIEGRTWGWDRRGVWVSHGCRGEFALGGGGYGRPDWGGPGYGGGYDRGYDRGYGALVRCESYDGRYSECIVGRGVRDVVIERQLSRSYCEEGYSWGRTRGGIWVDRGCRADFRVY